MAFGSGKASLGPKLASFITHKMAMEVKLAMVKEVEPKKENLMIGMR